MGSTSHPPRQQVLDWLADHVPEARLQHILRVEQMAGELAQAHGLSVEKAMQAGLLHDLAKYFKPQLLLEMAQQQGVPIDPIDEANPHLLHAEVGAIVAHQGFGVTDPDILQAIANHTLGQPEMSPLSCVVFLADSLEPGRGDTEVLDRLRQVSREDLLRAVWLVCDTSIQSLLQTQRLIHPRTVLTRNWFFQQAKQPPIHLASHAAS